MLESLKKSITQLKNLNTPSLLAIGVGLILIVGIVIIVITSDDPKQSKTVEDTSTTIPASVSEDDIGLRNGRWNGYYVNFRANKLIKKTSFEDQDLGNYSENIFFSYPDGTASMLIYPKTVTSVKDITPPFSKPYKKGWDIRVSKDEKQNFIIAAGDNNLYVASIQFTSSKSAKDSKRILDTIIRSLRSNKING